MSFDVHSLPHVDRVHIASRFYEMVVWPNLRVMLGFS